MTSCPLRLAGLGHRTCIFDADLGLANINILLGLYPEHTIHDVILGNKPLSDIIIRNYRGVDIIPGSSGIETLANIAAPETDHLIKALTILDSYDYLIFDTSAGVSRNVVSFCLASSEIIIVITPEPTSLTDAYALVKILYLNGLEAPVRVVVNQCKNVTIAKQIYLRFKEVVKKYLSLEVQLMGAILEDANITEAVKKQEPFLFTFPETIASKCIKIIAKNLTEPNTNDVKTFDIESFWKRCLSLFKAPLKFGRTQPGTKKVHDKTVSTENKEPDPSTKSPATTAAVKTTYPFTGHERQPAQETTSSDKALEPSRQVEQNPPVKQQESIRLKSVQYPVTPPEPAENGVKTSTTYTLDQNLHQLFGKLVDNMASISRDVKKLRKTVEGNGIGNLNGIASRHRQSADSQPKPIILNFENFVNERNDHL